MDSIYYKYLKKIKMNSAFVFLLVIYILPNSLYSQELASKVVAYYAGWGRNTLPPNNIQFDNVTHINHAFAWPNADGSIAKGSNVPDLELINEAHISGKKVLISLGGAGSAPTAGFVAMSSDSATRAIFIENMMNFIVDNGYNGIDLDWEFPATNTETQNYTKLVREFRAALDSLESDGLAEDLLLTMAAPPTNWFGRWFNYEDFIDYMDWIYCMAYNFHGEWTSHAGHNAPLFSSNGDVDGSGDEGIKYYINTRKIPKDKLLLGLPFYGRQFNASSLYGSSSGGGEVHYRNIISTISSGWTTHWDDVAKVPYAINDEQTRLITYDDKESMRIKVEYARNQELAGVMIWELTEDVSDSLSLLKAVGDAMRAPLTSVDVSTNETITTFQLFDNYPNPFNGSTIIEFYLPKDQNIELSIYNALGQQVAILRSGFTRAGKQSILWNAAGVPGGAYFYMLKAGSFTATKKMIYIR